MSAIDETTPQDRQRTRFRVSGMDCGSCAAKIETALRRVAGVHEVRVSVPNGTMTVTHDPSTGSEAIIAPVARLGYQTGPAEVLTAGGGAMERNHDTGSCCGHDHSHAGGDGHGHDHAHSHSHSHGHVHGAAEDPDPAFAELPWWRRPKARLALASGLALGAAYVVGALVPAISQWAFLLAMAVGLLPIARRAMAAAGSGTPFSIEMLMTIAAVGAVVIGAVEEATAVVFLFLVGELLEGVAAGRARASIQGLIGLMPDTALVEGDGRGRDGMERDGGPRSVPASSLTVGAVILVRPGDRVAADGVILSGDSALDEAPVTGESVPKRKGEGDRVFAGTINGDGTLRVRVSAAAKDNTIARVVRLVEEAQESKAPTERFIDRFSRWYTPGVVVVAALVAVLPPLLAGGSWGEWVYKGLAVLLIGCPCALVISTPAAIAAGLSNGARRGLLMKGGAVLEALGRITTVAFDKTGTLTEGRPRVTDVIAFAGGEQEVLLRAAALETGSSHPLAKAVLAAAAEAGLAVTPASDAGALAGKGVRGWMDGLELALVSPQAAQERAALTPDQAERVAALNGEGKTVSVLLVDGRVSGLLAMRDEPRADAQAGVAALRAAGIRSLMVTGDNARTARAVADRLGVEPHAELLPEDKQRIVRDLQARGERVAKVGDGINDAPALAAADVGIAMGGGADVALETADAAALHARVGDVAAMVHLSRRTMANIRQNIVLALGLKAVFLVTTVAGITGLWPAILADTGATVLVTANALRLLSLRP
ncbi:heavy metal translocating P-type ATPase [Azospirillum picis]|uniref:P-type Zn(2+) transporter n=1 Tax=Azospirillum picis TaxID=488438 RepID=A0ABU0MNE5_9PROT|nr:heavy metal translocating P-type ATPase [Azospirillum picis]MBP2301845.1 Cd2+/Zn2+-exporting ATPase [Azospirillum picis]MDQ0534980.1 Cd2+/Zn2+-exporting ATPase [Azospirillum picis]